MQTAVAETTTAAGTVDEQLTTRLLYQRIIVLGTEVATRVSPVGHPGQPRRHRLPGHPSSASRGAKPCPQAAITPNSPS
jgi:hypothetical protein